MRLFRFLLVLAALGTTGACTASSGPTQPDFPSSASFDLEDEPPPPPPPAGPTNGSGG